MKLSCDKAVAKPVVSVYPAASRAHLEGKTSLLCLASGMFPPLVQFSWKRQDGSSAEGEQLELRELGRTTSILLVDRDAFYTYKYNCSVKHETGTVEAQIQREVPAPAASCPPEREPTEQPAPQQADGSPGSSPASVQG
ncbi:immunoglobulin lambda-like polypeptide 5, partial [Lates japonicus]